MILILVMAVVVSGIDPVDDLPFRDRCSWLDEESSCVDGICVHLWWLDRVGNIYTYSTSDFVSTLLTSVECGEALNVQVEDWPVIYIGFNLNDSIRMYNEMMTLMLNIIHRLVEFPRNDGDQPIESHLARLEDLLSLSVEVGRFEAEVAVKHFLNQAFISSYMVLLNNVASSLFLHGCDIEESLRKMFGGFASLGQMLGLLGVSKNMDLRPFLTHSVAYCYLKPLRIEHSTRGETLADIVRTMVQKANAVRISYLSGNLVGRIDDVGILNFFGASRVLSVVSKSEEESDSPSALLRRVYKSQVCPNLVAVGEYVAFLLSQVQQGWPISITLLGIGQAVALCRDKTSAVDRIRVSSLVRGREYLHPFVQEQIYLRPEYLIEDSHTILSDTARFWATDLVVVVEGSEHVGYIGQRKQWIDQMVREFFFPGTDMFDRLWQYTDSTNRFIVLKGEDESEWEYAKAAGRVMGLAIKYGIQMSVPLARSFLKHLGSQVRPVGDIHALMRDEDPVLARSLEALRVIDWTDPPAGIEWMTFENLKLNGEEISVSQDNVEEFIKLKSDEWFFGSQQGLVRTFRDGIGEVVGIGVFSMLSEQELEERVLPNLEALTPAVMVQGMTLRNFDSDPLMGDWLKESIGAMSTEELYMLNFFVSGVRQPPLTASTEPWIRVFLEPSLSPGALPRSHTCHNELQLPLYPSKEILASKLLQAIQESNTIDGFAGYITGHAP